MRNTKEINIHIGAQIKKAREAAGYTQDQLAELIQMGTKNLSAVERGVAGVSLEAMRRICKTMAISSDMLIMDDVADIDKDKMDFVITRLQHLTEENFEFAYDMLNTLFKVFAARQGGNKDFPAEDIAN